MELRELLQEYVDLSYKELWEIAYNAWAKMKPYFDKATKDGDGTIFIIGFLGTSLAADGKFTDLECQLVCDLFGVDADTAKSVYSRTSKETLDIIDNVFDEMLETQEIKVAVLTFCLCFLAVDETINRDEIAFIQRLMN